MPRAERGKQKNKEEQSQQQAGKINWPTVMKKEHGEQQAPRTYKEDWLHSSQSKEKVGLQRQQQPRQKEIGSGKGKGGKRPQSLEEQASPAEERFCFAV